MRSSSGAAAKLGSFALSRKAVLAESKTDGHGEPASIALSIVASKAAALSDMSLISEGRKPSMPADVLALARADMRRSLPVRGITVQSVHLGIHLQYLRN